MNRYLKTFMTAALPAVVLAGCNDFLKCSECVTDPDSPTAATSAQRYVATQSALWETMNGDLARLIAMWMQSMAGTDRQFLSYGTYVIGNGDYDGEFSRAYRPALLDLKTIEATETEGGNLAFVGVAQVNEAWLIGNVADIWGDVPYSQAAKPDSFPTPVYDSQESVYAALQSLLDQAISNLGAGGTGPGPVDLVYYDDDQQVQLNKWVELAHTLKARLYLHTAEQDPSAYAKALAEANLGISSNDGDYVIPYTGNQNESNNWFEFLINQRFGYMSPGAKLIDVLQAAGDPRINQYFVAGDSGYIRGAAPGEGYDGVLAQVNPNTRGAADYKQALVTYNENLLIKAEALYQTGQTGPALAALNEELAAWSEATAWHAPVTLPAKSGLTGQALLDAIMTEKYITLFQNLESWNDYKRTCIPALTPAKGKAEIPGRLPYTATELSTNPDNVPADPLSGRNWNDPNACPAP
jgi:hypothetical protein